ncbi:1-acyl-sn-glycerol-3-phosphate acyltransferase [Polaribacter huanghezhanensis]|uniref:lysophospholipid acyltransferase family protein n=1 Tax=Polaribacter huanghezhanensis TaxID=1354726 RepID=UPI00264A299D|nr:lysophospholipid acyltransferase family protein [Polaribacter huanghezhanensis]WKD85522.1 1-acyl-sn-glycerol-3-phosphate acyltransferase [Polaribacter huanghezhanensis]
MEFFKNSLRAIWRVWFYVFFGASLLLMMPFLFILTFSESQYSFLYKIIRAFSKTLIFVMGFRLQKQIEEPLDLTQSYMFCPNHTSMLDPFILISMVKKPIVFVGKAELKKIPVFGYFYKRICILVDRGSQKSRKEVYFSAKRRLKNGASVAIFPEGLVPTEDVVLSPFKNGAFSLAIEHQIPIVPATYFDCKRLFSWTYFKGKPGTIRIKQHKPIHTKGLDKKSLKEIKEQTFTVLFNELSNDVEYMKDTKGF